LAFAIFSNNGQRLPGAQHGSGPPPVDAIATAMVETLGAPPAPKKAR
jgi:hypothetical protein